LLDSPLGVVDIVRYVVCTDSTKMIVNHSERGTTPTRVRLKQYGQNAMQLDPTASTSREFV